MKGELQLETLADRNPSDLDPLIDNHNRGEDQVDGSVPCCRICLGDNDDDDLISPCKCKGTQQFVHRMCLDHWRSVKEAFSFPHCTTCKAQFHLEVVKLEDSSWRKMKFRLFVAGDISLVFLAVHIASMEACYALVLVLVVIFPIVVVVYAFLAATMDFQRIWRYRSLTKRELTQEFVVKDLHGCYPPPKLDAKDEELLKMLKLL